MTGVNMNQLEEIKSLVSKKSDAAVTLAKQIWEFAELAYKETKSCSVMVDAIKKRGLRLILELPGYRQPLQLPIPVAAESR